MCRRMPTTPILHVCVCVRVCVCVCRGEWKGLGCGANGALLIVALGTGLKPVRTPVAILGSLGVCIYVPASRHWLISYSPIHLN